VAITALPPYEIPEQASAAYYFPATRRAKTGQVNPIQFVLIFYILKID